MNKVDCRKIYRHLRRIIATRRRLEAQHQLNDWSKWAVASHPLILSYASFGSELNTDTFNLTLVQAGKLVLPKVVGNTLQLFHVEKLDHLIEGKWGIREPNPDQCSLIDPKSLSLVLIPGVAFDTTFNRIGYGKGYYDRLLSTLAPSAFTLGIGFKEQLSTTPLTKASHDIPLKALHLF